MRRDRNDGAGHRLLEKQRSCRWIVRGVIPANLSLTRGEAASDDTKLQSNTHIIESQEVRIDGTLGMDGESGSTKIWKNAAKGYDDVAARTT
jgi:hypothetical protein